VNGPVDQTEIGGDGGGLKKEHAENEREQRRAQMH
jgi:hypothetical protein